LLGTRLRAHIVTDRPSHGGNVALANAIRRESRRAGAPVADTARIMQFLPHRYPMLLVDRILDFEPGERPGEAIVISESLSRRLWPDGDAIGARLQWGDPRSPRASTVVGIVGDVRFDAVDGPPRPHLYAPIADEQRRRFLVVRTDQPAAAVTRSWRVTRASTNQPSSSNTPQK